MSEARSVEKSGRSVEEALEAALDELGVSRDQVEVEVLDEPNRRLLGFIGGKLARIRVTVRQAPRPQAAAEVGGAPDSREVPSAGERAAGLESEEARRAIEGKVGKAKEFVREVARLMGAAGHVETRRVEPDLFTLNVVSQQSGLLIGRRGQTLDALQYLANVAANRGIEGPWVRFVLDTGDYRRRREAFLRTMALRVARQVRQQGKSVALEPMNPLERRIVHLALRDDPAVTTRSEGQEPQRRVVIMPRRGQGTGDDGRAGGRVARGRP